MTENDRIVATLAQARAWLLDKYGEPNRSATSWRVGGTNVEMSYVLGEGSLHFWHDGQRGITLRTRGRDESDIDQWLGALEACHTPHLAPS
jgi:hypothetical protein